MMLLVSSCAAVLPRMIIKAPVSRMARVLARYENDPWMDSDARSPFSPESTEVLFKYGPVVYGARCFNSEEYNESVCQIMERWPKISRALAEQEVHLYLSDMNGYMASQTPEREVCTHCIANAHSLTFRLLCVWLLSAMDRKRRIWSLLKLHRTRRRSQSR